MEDRSCLEDEASYRENVKSQKKTPKFLEYLLELAAVCGAITIAAYNGINKEATEREICLNYLKTHRTGEIEYIIKEGDSLSRIASRYLPKEIPNNIEIEYLQEYNGMPPSQSSIIEGNSLMIPLYEKKEGKKEK